MLIKLKVILLLIVCVCSSVMGQKYSGYPYTESQPVSWSGTGWLLNNGYVVTNHHVAENARTITLKFPNEYGWEEYSAEPVLLDDENDLAILRVLTPEFGNNLMSLPYALKTSLADVGESIFVLGYPMTTTMGDEIKLTTGVISSHSGFQGFSAQYQISAPVQPGNSGGPLFDENGNIIGVVNAKHTGAENVGYAIKASYLKELIDQLPNSNHIIPTTNHISSQNLPEKVRSVKNFVCLIQCSSVGIASSNSKYGAPIIPKNDKVIENPYVDLFSDPNTRIKNVILTDEETIIELSCNNLTENGYFESINIKSDTYIIVDNKRYTLLRTEGIAIAPRQTKFDKVGETKHFKLIFPQIPKSSTSLSLIEPGEGNWFFYGVLLKEY